jgi:hypothetical protein
MLELSDGPDAGRWSLSDGVIYLDAEENPIRRTIRPIGSRLGFRFSGRLPLVTECASADRIVIPAPNGNRDVWTRDRGD